VGSTLRTLKGGPEPTEKLNPASPSAKTVSLLEILTQYHVNDKEDLEQLSFWAISQVDILRGLSKQQRQHLRGLGRIEHFEPNIDICTEGAEACKLYLVEEGRVAVESQVARGMRFPISIVYPGQAFGWSALVLPNVYTATVMALSRTRVIAIEQKAMLAMMQADPMLGFTIMQNVASIVGSRLRTLEMQLVGLLQQGH
jgi:CRP-like cAMP-binding protein